MSASLIDPRGKKRAAGRKTIIYVCIALFCGLFSAIYEHFSHQVYSNDMIYLFAYPLLLGALPYLGISLSKRLPLPTQHAADAWDCGVTTLAVGSCVSGVLEIYGTTSNYVAAYRPAGILLLAAGLALYVRATRTRGAESPEENQNAGA